MTDAGIIRAFVDQIDALQAEHGKLLVELTHRVGWEERCLRAEAENERLRIDNQNLQGEVMDSDHNELVQLRTEVRQLRAELDQDAKRFFDVGLRLGQADKEIARLRKVLDEIASEDDE